MTPTPRLALLGSVLALLVAVAAAPGLTVGQEGTPAASPGASPAASPVASPAASPAADLAGDRYDLAAVPLDAAALPEGYGLLDESYTPGGDVVAAIIGEGGPITQEALDAAGLRWWYQSVYGRADSDLSVRFYVEEYGDAEGATAGFELLEDESELPQGGESEDRPLEGIGEEPSELSLSTIPFPGGFTYRSADATFRLGRVVAGVAVENFSGAEPDADLALALAEDLAERTEAVVGGESPAGVDLALARALSGTAAPAAVIAEGYLAASEAVLPATGGYRGGYVRTEGIPFASAPDAPPVLFVNHALLRFSTPAGAEAARYAAEDLPFPSPLPRPGDALRQQGGAVTLDGGVVASTVRAGLLPGVPLDSVRLAFAVEDRLALVEVAGAATVDRAEVAAEDLANRLLAGIRGQAPSDVEVPAAELQATALEAAPELEPAEGGDPDRAAVFDEVWRTVRDYSVYRTGRENLLLSNYKLLDWGAVRAAYEPRALAAESDAAFYAVLAEMVAELEDQHSGFLSPEEALDYDAFFGGDLVYVGTGALPAGNQDPLSPGLVLDVLPGSPAEEAGIARRDRILAVDGRPVAGADEEDPAAEAEPVEEEDVLEAVTRLTAPDRAPDDAGPPVTLLVQSPGEEPREVEVERRVAEARIGPTASRLEADPSVGYLIVPDLATPDMEAQVIAALEGLLDEGPLRGLVLDLRANPGGYPQQVLTPFVAGEVGRTYARDGRRPAPFVVSPDPIAERLADVPLVALIDDRMFSASEIAAAVLQHEGRARLVGVRTPGDVESVPTYDFADGSRLSLASTVFTLPGEAIEGTGVVPDVTVDLDWTRYPEAEDPHILAALDLLDEEGGDAATPAATPVG